MRGFQARVASKEADLLDLDGLALDLRAGVRLINSEHLKRGNSQGPLISKPSMSQEQPSKDHPKG